MIKIQGHEKVWFSLEATLKWYSIGPNEIKFDLPINQFMHLAYMNERASSQICR